MIEVSKVIAPSFYECFWDVWEENHTHYWHKGGRGSTKSSYISSSIILKMMDDAEKGILSNALIVRRVKDTLEGSVFEQMVWAIDKLGVQNYWKIKLSPLRLIYIPTGQQVLFKGADNPKKLKSTKVSKGWIKYIWYEEVDEFENYDKIRNINQSIMRGGTNFLVFYSFNPPESQRNWTNMEVLDERKDKLVHHSTYLTVAREWLGEQFIIEAEHLKKSNPKKYEHDYLGEVTGTGREVFTNVTIRKIADEEIKIFDRIRQGLDFGYGADPLSFTLCHYDKKRKRLFIFGEVYKCKLGNSKAVEEISNLGHKGQLITADSAEPRTINEFKQLGLVRIKGAKKGPDSIDHGIKFLSEEIEEIVIDKERAPNHAREFMNYELELDKQGNPKGSYPDKDNHSIDSTRYALEEDMLIKRGTRLGKR